MAGELLIFLGFSLTLEHILAISVESVVVSFLIKRTATCKQTIIAVNSHASAVRLAILHYMSRSYGRCMNLKYIFIIISNETFQTQLIFFRKFDAYSICVCRQYQ